MGWEENEHERLCPSEPCPQSPPGPSCVLYMTHFLLCWGNSQGVSSECVCSTQCLAWSMWGAEGALPWSVQAASVR